MPLKAHRDSQSKQAKGRKRGNRDEEEQPFAGQTSSRICDAAESMLDEAQEEKQADVAKPANKKSRIAPTAAAASSSAAGAAAASSASAPSPCARLDLDSLSAVFSLLDTRDFLHAVRVSRHWRAARTKKSAWPAFSLETMIQSLRDDDFDNPQRRKLEVAISSGNHRKLSTLLSKSGVLDLWRHVTEIKIVHERWSGPHPAGLNPRAKLKQIAASTAMLPLLSSQFPSLVALTLDGFFLPTDDEAEQKDRAAADLFSALAGRLTMLFLFHCTHSFELQLHRLGSSLRVLTLGWIPDPCSLLQLHQLAYMHVEPNSSSQLPMYPAHHRLPCAKLGFVIRWLSVHPVLRSLSVERATLPLSWHDQSTSSTHTFLPALLSCDAPLSRENEAALAELTLAAPLNPPLDLSVPCALSDLSLNELASAATPLLHCVPSLTRLQWRPAVNPLLNVAPILMFESATQLSRSLQLTLPRIRELRAAGDEPEPHWIHLAQCTALRVVHLTQHRDPRSLLHSTPLTRSVLRALLAAWAGTIEECRLDLEMQLEKPEESNSSEEWTELASCHRLRLLELALKRKGQALPGSLVTALQELSAFQSLFLSWSGSAMCPLPPNLLSVMVRSRFFSTLHLQALSAGSRLPDFVQSADAAGAGGGGLTSMLAALDPALQTLRTIDRLRVVGAHHDGPDRAPAIHSYRIA